MHLLTLSIDDPKLKTQYLMNRSREILKLSTLVLILRLIMVVGLIIGIVVNDVPFILKGWLYIGGSLIWQLLLILLTWKFPLVFSIVHAPLLSINYLFIIYQFYDKPPVMITLISLMLYYLIFQLSAVTLNYSWILSSLGIFSNTIGLIYYLQ